jgi:putative ATP-binding cassette transporter
MQILAVAVAAVAVLAALAGFQSPAGAGFAAYGDPGLYGLALAGAILAFSTFGAIRISSFLRIFSTIFAVEYILTGLAFIAQRKGMWPGALADLQVPLSLPVTIAVFSMIVWSISFIPVIRQITTLADPYFSSDSKRDVAFGPFGVVNMAEGRLGRMLVTLLVVLNQLQVGISVRLSFFNRDWFDAIQKKDEAAFWSLLITVFCFWATIAVMSNLIEYFFEAVLKINWRKWLTQRYADNWLGRGGLYRMALIGDGADNPDQRIADDVRGYIDNTYAYSIQLLSTISNLVSFSIILWTIPAEFAIPGTSIIVPGLPFWVALVYSVLGTWLAHLIGRPLIKLDFMKERFEADFRFTLARLREYSEQVALLRGERSERDRIRNRFGNIVTNYFAIVVRQLKLSTFTHSFFQASVVIPYMIVAPYYFLGKISLGQMSQTAGAFGRVESAMTFFIARYSSLAAFKAIVDRLTSFGAAIEKAANLGEPVRGPDGNVSPHIKATRSENADLTIRDAVLSLPNGREIVRVDDLALKGGKSTLVNGPSGSGKSTMFRAIAGIWPYGRGTIAFPAGEDGHPIDVMLLPQRPYIAAGTLKRAASYPAVEGDYSDENVRDALIKARLPMLVDQLDVEEAWSQRLSGGEQQRLSIAHALLAKPKWLFLDEATSALDEKLEGELYRMLKEELPGTTIVSIGHRSTLVNLHDDRIELQAGDDGLFRPVRVAKAEA